MKFRYLNQYRCRAPTFQKLQEENQNGTSEKTATKESNRAKENTVQNTESRQTQEVVEAESKTETKPAEKTPYDELHGNLKTNTHPRLKAWLDANIKKVAENDKSARLKLKLFGNNPLTNNQLDNAEKNLVAYEKEHGKLPDKLDFEAHETSIADEELNEAAAKDRNIARAFRQLGAEFINGKFVFLTEKTSQKCIAHMKNMQSNNAKNLGIGTLKDALKSIIALEKLNSIQKALSDFANRYYNFDAKFSHKSYLTRRKLPRSKLPKRKIPAPIWRVTRKSRKK